ncbi:hypothetical protein HA402_014217 [Bradysia odoriphaga]|nr:hypothetical protein HA402_014217 [Bradysia odoriphaga]
MAQYNLSSLGRLFVADEGLEYLPPIRKVFAVVTALLGIITLARFSLVLISKNSSVLKFGNLSKTVGGTVVLIYIVSYVIHTIHYVDNICRPVAYFEPKWLYQKYLISEMEITFFANFPITLSGLYIMELLVDGINKEKYRNTVSGCKKMIGYILGSLLTLGHYRTEPPWKYETFVNFTIAGEGVATILLALLLYQLRRKSLRMLDAQQSLDTEQSEGLLYDDNDEEGQTQYAMKTTGVRSRTPVKT